MHIHLHQILRKIRVERGAGKGNFGALIQGFDKLQRHFVERFDFAAVFVLQTKFKAVGGTETGNHGGRENHHLRLFHFFFQKKRQLVDDLLKRIVFSFVPVFEIHNKVAVATAVAGDKAEARDFGTRLDGRVRRNKAVDTVHHQVGLIKRGGRRQGYADKHHPVVFVWHQAFGRIANEQNEHKHKHRHACKRQVREANKTLHALFVRLGGLFKKTIETVKEIIHQTAFFNGLFAVWF